jgi:Zn-dependent protease
VQVGLLPVHGEIRLHDLDAEALGYRAYHTARWSFEWGRGSWRAPAITVAGSLANLLVAAGILSYWVWMPRLTPHPFTITAAVFVVNLLMYLNLIPVRGLDGGRLVVQTAAFRRQLTRTSGQGSE